MGFVTVLVQHAWALQPTTSSRGATPRQATEQGGTSRRRSAGGVSLIPETVTAFLRDYRAAVTHSASRRFEKQAVDLLDRLHHVVMGPALANAKRDNVSRAATPSSASMYKPAKGVPRLASGRLRRAHQCRYDERCTPAYATRKHALRARQSLVAFTQCPHAPLRDMALEYLYEAVDCGNELRHDELELENLLALVGDMADAIATLRRNANQNHQQMEASLVGRLVLCLSMVAQRLKYAYDRKHFSVDGESRNNIERCIEEMQNINTDDPFMEIILEFAQELLRAIAEGSPVSAQAINALPTIILSQTLRGEVWTDSASATQTCITAMEEMAKGGRRNTREFLELLATGAMRDELACFCLLACLKSNKLQHDWPTLFYGTMLLAAVVQHHEKSAIGSLALEGGLLHFLHYRGDGQDMSEQHVQNIRTGAILALAAVWKQCQASSLALMAVENIRMLDQDAGMSTLQTLLHHQQKSPVFRISHLFSYKAMSLAEHLLESRTDTKSSLHSIPSTRWKRSMNHGLTEAMSFNLQTPLSIAPYHRNFLAGLGVSTMAPVVPGEVSEQGLAPSFLTTHMEAGGMASQPVFGTANRRKLFHATPGPPVVKHEPKRSRSCRIEPSDRLVHTLPKLRIET
ncbi:hypothetical protein DFJ77DRAFT_463579 [Powellomyces hirtus]|nr:hypothetical protein DFJ77DRAFT_463579 [Powellomyces hirtus]